MKKKFTICILVVPKCNLKSYGNSPSSHRAPTTCRMILASETRTKHLFLNLKPIYLGSLL